MNTRDLSQKDLDLSVWRYMPFSKFISLLTYGALWFPKLNILQDQYEGTMPHLVKEMMDQKHDSMKKGFHPSLHSQFDNMAARNVEDSRELIVANSWFLNESESKTMWTDYGEGNDSVAIKSTVGRLTANIAVPNDTHVTHIGRVKYVDFNNHSMSDYEANQGIERAFLKDKGFQHEEELRIATMSFKTVNCIRPDGERYTAQEVKGKNMNNFDFPGLYIMINFPELVSSIVIHPESESWLLPTIKRVMKLSNLNVPVALSELTSA